MPKNSKASALKNLRNACLRIDVILCLNEADDPWLVKDLKSCLRSLRFALRVLDPGRRLPSVMEDTRLGRELKTAKAEMRKASRCKHDWKPIPKKDWLFKIKGQKWRTCSKCEYTESYFPES